MELNRLKIAFLGDSITYGVGVENGDNIFVNRLKKDEKLKETYNYGVSGTRIARNHNVSPFTEWDYCFLDRVDEMNCNPDVVVVFGGTNDFGHGDGGLGNMDCRDEYSFYGALHCLCNKLIDKFTSSRIVFITPLHRLSEDEPVNELGIKREGNLKAYVEAVKNVCEYYSLPVFDLYAESGIQPRLQSIKEKYCPDGLHPNDSGHEILASMIAGFLKSL